MESRTFGVAGLGKPCRAAALLAIHNQNSSKRAPGQETACRLAPIRLVSLRPVKASVPTPTPGGTAAVSGLVRAPKAVLQLSISAPEFSGIGDSVCHRVT
ncbi:hypothetical protein M404DRAFT_999494, partial [Pisolithus tinctorius Marx 270]